MLAIVACFLVKAAEAWVEGFFAMEGKRPSDFAAWKSKTAKDLMARREQELQVNIGCRPSKVEMLFRFELGTSWNFSLRNHLALKLKYEIQY